MIDEAADLVVDQAKHAEVVGPVAAPGSVVAGALLLDQGAEPLPLRPFGGDGFGASDTVGNLVFRKEAEVGLGDLVGVVGLGKAQPEEEGFGGIVLVEVGDGVADDAVRLLAFERERGRRGMGGVVEGVEPVVEFDVGRGAAIGMAAAGVHVGRGPVEGVVGQEAVVLASEPGGVAEIVEGAGQVGVGLDVGESAVLADAGGLRIAAGEQAGAGGSAGGHRGVGVAEADTSLAEVIDEGGGIERIALGAGEIGALLIGHDEHDVGTRGHGEGLVKMVVNSMKPPIPGPVNAFDVGSWELIGSIVVKVMPGGFVPEARKPGDGTGTNGSGARRGPVDGSRGHGQDEVSGNEATQ